MPSPADLEFRELAPADQATYDAFVGQHELNDFAQAWAWGEVKGRGEWTPRRAGLFRGDELVAAAQVLFRRLPLGRSLAYASRGPIVDLTTSAGASERAALFDGLEQLCRRERAICLKLDPCLPVGNELFLALCGARPTPGQEGRFGGTQPRFVMRLDLRPGLEAVMAGFKADYRTRIRKSERRGVTVRQAESASDWQAFYNLLLETAERQQFTVRAKSYFDAIAAELTGACRASVLLAEREGRCVGAILCIRYGHTAWYLYGGMNDEGREHYSGYLLQWRAMEWAVEAGCETYDFRGVAPPEAVDSPLYGLNRFKSGFGPELVEWVGEYDVVLDRLGYRAFTSLLPRVKSLLKRRR
ncbi:MAG: peptidoglycan bridge formation glycyltransferase FemA/FemB family protein [Armatimonadetes bacterium]|nr:peptidoglycan bridge formation glycyltransferase FemA/FemB family protein [Armatimonadota bacterium]